MTTDVTSPDAQRGAPPDPIALAERADAAAAAGDRESAAADLLAAFVLAPSQLAWLERSCALMGRPYRDPGDGRNPAPITPFERLCLYADVAAELAASGEKARPSFARCAAWAEAHGVDLRALLLFLLDINVGADFALPRALGGADSGWDALRVEGWVAVAPARARRLRAAGLIADAAAAEGGDDAAVAPLVVVETDEGPVVPGQDATGEALRDTLVAIAAELEGDDRVVLAVGHPALDRPATALALAEPGRVRALGWGDARFELTRLTRDEHHRLDVLGERVRSFRPPVEAIRTAPTDDEQAWLLERLAELCAAVGAAPFIAPPLEPRDIVGEFHGDASSIHRLLRGLMDFVGLRDARVELLIADGTAVGHRPPGGEGRVTLAWFSGFDHTGQSALFGFDPARHAEPEDVLATLAHEVAHAFRVRRGLMVDDRDEEELLTDLTASFLGFGISLTNSAYRYRTGGEVTGTRVTHWTEVRTGGYLPAQAFAWLLALQVVARRGGWRDARAVARRLEANQASWFRASLRSLAPRAEALRAGLGVAHADVPRGRAARRRLVLGVASSPGDVTVDRGIKGLAVVDRLGQPVFRVARRGREPLTWALAFLGFFAFLASGLFDGAARIAVASGSVAAVVGLLTFGPRERGDACSGCSSVLPEAATRCPRCRGDVSGRIATVGEHDAAAAAARPGGHRSGA